MTCFGRVSVSADSVAVLLAFVVATAVSSVALVAGGGGVRPSVAASPQTVYVPTRLVESACACVRACATILARTIICCICHFSYT